MIREDSPNNLSLSQVDLNARLITIFDHILESCQVIDFDYRYAYLNDAAVRAGKTTREALMGKRVTDCWPGIEKTPMWVAICYTMENRVAHRIETDFTFPDGSVGWFDMSIQPVSEGVLIFTLDITERKIEELRVRNNEEHLRLAVESASIGTYETNLQTLTTYFSAQLARLIGRGDEPFEVPYEEALNIFHPDDREQVRTRYCPLGQKNPPEFNQIEARIVLPDGRVRWFTWKSRTQYLTILDGRVPYKTIGAAIDITDRKEAQAKFDYQANLLQAVTDGATDAIYVRDLNGKYIFINRAACMQFDLDPNALVGKDDSALFQPDSVRFIRQLDQQIIRTGEIVEITEEIVNNDGHKCIYHSVKSPYRDSSGKVIGVIGFSRDITERELQRKEIQAAELRYRVSIDHATDGITIFDALINGKIIDCNLRASELLGYSREELVGMRPEDMDVDLNEESKHKINRELKVNQVYVFRTRHRRKDGSVFPVEVRLRPFKLNESEYVIAILRDLTDEIKSQELAQKNQQQMKAAQLISKLGVWDWDLKEETVWWSDELFMLFGYEPRTFTPTLGRFMEMLTPQTQEIVSTHIESTIQTGAPYKFEVPVIDATLKDKWFYIEGTLEKDSQGKPKKLWGVCQDITERKKMAEEAQNARNEIAHLSRVASVGEMASSLAHELNQPLTVIKSYAGVSLDMARKRMGDAESDRQAELMQEINTQANRAAEIIRSLRAFLRKQSTQKSNIDINLVITQSVDLIRHELSNSSVGYKVHLGEDLPLVHADPIQLQQVLVNLVQNAIDAMNDNALSTEKTLVIQTNRTPKGVRVDVIDSGQGIAVGDEKKIFQSFYTTKANGLGLGLPICHSIIESHGGSFGADRAETRGMRFFFELPVIRA